MKIANILPADLLEPVLGPEEKENYHLILASQILRNDTYRWFYQNRIKAGDHVILDNDAYENGGPSSALEVLAECLVFFGRSLPQEVVLPDVMYGETCAQDTVKRSLEGSVFLSQNSAFKFAFSGGSRFPDFVAVPHGNTLDEYVWCAMKLSAIPGVKTLGIAEMDALKLANGDRGVLVRAILGLHKKIHLFGMMEDMSDISDPFVRTAVRGVDGAKLGVWGLNRQSVFPTRVPRYPGRPKNFFDIQRSDVDNGQLDTILWNIRVWREFAEGKK